jgi:CheY-like chemotaxis protein
MAEPGKVLVVDDNPQVRALTVEMFQSLGLEVHDAYNGEDAMRLLSANPDIAMMLVDVRMPGMTGAELATKARQLRPHLHVVLISGYAEEPPLADVPFLRKPIRMAVLEEFVASAARRNPPAKKERDPLG